MTVDRYLDRLAAKTPVPGGGSAAALAGAIGISLLLMTARYMSGKAGGGMPTAELHKLIRFAERSQHRLKKIMAEDEIAYLRLSRRLKKRRSKDISMSYKRAADVPMKACLVLHEGLKKCERLIPHCKTSIASDLAEAAILMEAGFLSAKANVDMNLKEIKDAQYTKRSRNHLSNLAGSVSMAKNKVLKQWRRTY
jgi:methenyltetrahydrofolate cyclohydrolase